MLSLNAGNIVKPLSRRLIAGVLALMFVAIILSPLANLGMQLMNRAHATVETCTGDCDTCGCSPERKALHTCCCQTRLRHHDYRNERQIAGCCNKRDNKRIPAISRACPCEKGKQLVLREKEEFPVPAYFDNEGIVHLREVIHVHNPPDKLVSRNIEPPVPPPEFSILL